jgi:hypothetical protein
LPSLRALFAAVPVASRLRGAKARSRARLGEGAAGSIDESEEPKNRGSSGTKFRQFGLSTRWWRRRVRITGAAAGVGAGPTGGGGQGGTSCCGRTERGGTGTVKGRRGPAIAHSRLRGALVRAEPFADPEPPGRVALATPPGRYMFGAPTAGRDPRPTK